MFDTQIRTRIEFADSTRQNHTEGTDIAAHTTRRTGIEELHILWLIEQEVEILLLIVDMRSNHGVSESDIEMLFQLNKRDTPRHFVVGLRVLAIDCNRGFHTERLVEIDDMVDRENSDYLL